MYNDNFDTKKYDVQNLTIFYRNILINNIFIYVYVYFQVHILSIHANYKSSLRNFIIKALDRN